MWDCELVPMTELEFDNYQYSSNPKIDVISIVKSSNHLRYVTITDLFSAKVILMGFPNILNPFRLFLAAVDSATSLNTTKACPLILLLRLTTICKI